MVVLSSKPLWFKILKFVYNFPVAGYPGYIKMYKIVQWVYYWPIMHDYVWKYIQVYKTCVCKKTSYIKK